jgi:hypothetical protein
MGHVPHVERREPCRRENSRPKEKPSLLMVAAFQVLLNCLDENDAVRPGQFPTALAVYIEMVKSRKAA